MNLRRTFGNMFRRKSQLLLLCAFVLLFIYNFFGVGDYIKAKSFKEFDYPLNVDLAPVVDDIMNGKKTDLKPINYYPYKFLSSPGICNSDDKIELLIVVKSAMDHFSLRMAIRNTYAGKDLRSNVKTLFVLGVDDGKGSNTQAAIDKEINKYKDIVQADFIDTYYNNTVKTMMSFRWLHDHCSRSDFYLFADDDMYISINNMFDFLRDKDKDKHLFAGFVFNSSPQRYKISKWRVSLDEYLWDRWPPYVTAGAYVLSNYSMNVMYIGSLFVKHFRFDDIYLGIVAKKVGIVPEHCDKFYFYKKKYSPEGYYDVIASHGYGDPAEMMRVWNEQNPPYR